MEHALNVIVLKAKTNRLYLKKIGRNVTTVAKLNTLKGVYRNLLLKKHVTMLVYLFSLAETKAQCELL